MIVTLVKLQIDLSNQFAREGPRFYLKISGSHFYFSTARQNFVQPFFEILYILRPTLMVSVGKKR